MWIAPRSYVPREWRAAGSAARVAFQKQRPTAHAQNRTAGQDEADLAADTPATPARFETGLEGRASRPRRGERVDFNLEDGDLMEFRFSV